MLPSEGCDMREKAVADGLAARAQLVHGAAEIDGVPEVDGGGGGGEVEARGAAPLVFEGTVADFPESMGKTWPGRGRCGPRPR